MRPAAVTPSAQASDDEQEELRPRGAQSAGICAGAQKSGAMSGNVKPLGMTPMIVVRLAGEHERLAERVRTRREQPLPQPVADDDGRRRADPVVRVGEDPPELRCTPRTSSMLPALRDPSRRSGSPRSGQRFVTPC